MPASILQTKLYTPQPRPDLVPRTRLLDTLDAGQHGKLTLISAPAGFGKTTLVSEWAAIGGQQIAWLSLEEGDNDTVRFLSYLIAALQTLAQSTVEGIVSTIGEDVLTLLQSAQPPPSEVLLTALLNEVSAVSGKFILVLDDYHVLESKSIDDALAFLIDHLPPQMHLVITTREDPNLPLARYRARAQLTELRAADLRFTPTEAAQFLNQSMGLTLSIEEIAALERRTEGWIAGLQMAALSMQGRADSGPNGVASFIQAFAGSHRFVVDYLVEEVLQQQPDDVRSFLMQSSILDRLSGPLCDAVTGQKDGKGMLDSLERDNLFLIPLDDQRQWYRYHHLFADVLHARMLAEQPAQVPISHQRASAWYEQNGLLPEAIHHALAAADFERAAGLIELARPTIERGRRDIVFRGWVEALPDELIRSRPVLNVGYALALIDAGELGDAEPRLQEVEEWLACEERPDLVVVDEVQFQALPASIATARVYHTLACGDISGTLIYAQQALDRLPKKDYARRGQVRGLQGLAYWTIGNLEDAQQALLDAGLLTQKAGTVLDTIPGIFVVADIQIARGQLREAAATYKNALRIVTEHDGPAPVGAENIYAGLGDIYREWGDLTAAAEALTKSKRLGERFGEKMWQYRWYLAQARLNQSLGEMDGAIEELNHAVQLQFLNPMPEARLAAALRVRIWLMLGRLSPALSWVREQGLSVDDDLSYPREFEHITLVRVLIAQYTHDRIDDIIRQAIGFLERLLNAAEEGQRIRSVIEILTLQALVCVAQDNAVPALVPLERALTLAEPEGYVRLFVDEGPPMAQLLREAATQRIMPGYISKLLAAFEAGNHQSLDTSSTSHQSPITTIGDSPSLPQPLIEPLSQRELDVLRLLKTELSGPEIADELVVALSTIRTHTKSIYGKLNVNNRRGAVKRAAELGLI